MSQTKMYPEASAMSFHGNITVPRMAVTTPPVLNDNLSGARLTNAFAGATMFAAMFVLSVATSKPAIARNVVTGPLFILAKSAMGSETPEPKMIALQLVMAIDMNEKAAMKNGRPIACPLNCARCDFAYRVKSLMFRLSVAQNPTTAVIMGKNTERN